MRPLAMMMARVHTASTSSKRCVEMMMIYPATYLRLSVTHLVFLIGIQAVGGFIEMSTAGPAAAPVESTAAAKSLRQDIIVCSSTVASCSRPMT